MPLILGRSCDLVKARHQKREPPKDDLGGETESRFCGVCRVKIVGIIVRGIPTGEAWSSGRRRRIDPLPTNGGLEQHHDALPCESLDCRFRGLGDWSRRKRPEHLFIQPEVVGVAFGSSPESVHPSDHVGKTFGIPFTSLTIPSVLHPEGLRFPGVLLGWVAH